MTRRFASDDDASDLLAGILADTESDAVNEEARRAEELAARRSQEVLRVEREREERRRDGVARLEAERARRAELDARRHLALRDEDELPAAVPSFETDAALAARVEAAEFARAQAEALLRAATAPVTTVPASAPPPVQPARPSRTGLLAGGLFLAAAAAMLAVAVATGGVALAVADNGPAPAVYAKAELHPVSIEAGAVERGFVATATPEVVEPAPARAPRGARPPRQREPKVNKPAKPRFDFGGGDDPFSSKRE